MNKVTQNKRVVNNIKFSDIFYRDSQYYILSQVDEDDCSRCNLINLSTGSLFNSKHLYINCQDDLKRYLFEYNFIHITNSVVLIKTSKQ